MNWAFCSLKLRLENYFRKIQWFAKDIHQFAGISNFASIIISSVHPKALIKWNIMYNWERRWGASERHAKNLLLTNGLFFKINNSSLFEFHILKLLVNMKPINYIIRTSSGFSSWHCDSNDNNN